MTMQVCLQQVKMKHDDFAIDNHLDSDDNSQAADPPQDVREPSESLLQRST